MNPYSVNLQRGQHHNRTPVVHHHYHFTKRSYIFWSMELPILGVSLTFVTRVTKNWVLFDYILVF